MELLDLEGIAGGRVWTGAEAMDLGLVDETGGFREALRKARELGGIERDAPGVLTKVTPPRSGRPSPGEPAQSLVEAIGEMWLALSELRAGGILALAPYEIFGRLIGFSAKAAVREGLCIERDPQQRRRPAGHGRAVGGAPVYGSEPGCCGGALAFPDLGAWHLPGRGRRALIRRDCELVDRAAFVRHLLGQTASTRPHAARRVARGVRNGARRRGTELSL